MSENAEELPKEYTNQGTKDDPILRSEYNARNKMCPKCRKPFAAERNKIVREDFAVIGAGAGVGAMLGGPPGAAVGGLCGWVGYLFSPVRYTCKFCGASFLVNKWF